MGKSTPNWRTFSQFLGILAYKSGWLIRRQVRIQFDHDVPAIQENSLDPENPEAVANENLRLILKLGTDQTTIIVIYERPIFKFSYPIT